MWRRSLPLVVLALLPIALPNPVTGQEEEPAEYAAPSMEEMMAAGAPGEMHQILARTVGTWDVTVKAYMDPTAGPMEMTGVSRIEMIMDGRYAAEHVDSEFMGMPFKGLGITGYNNTAERFESTWIDNMSTILYSYTGELDGDVITMTGTYLDPMSGEAVSQRSILTFVDDDHYRVEAYETRDGEERLSMEIEYSRSQNP